MNKTPKRIRRGFEAEKRHAFRGDTQATWSGLGGNVRTKEERAARLAELQEAARDGDIMARFLLRAEGKKWPSKTGVTK